MDMNEHEWGMRAAVDKWQAGADSAFWRMRLLFSLRNSCLSVCIRGSAFLLFAVRWRWR